MSRQTLAVLLLAAALLLVATPSAGDTGPTLAGSTAYNSQRKVAVSGPATAYVTYIDHVENVSTVFVKVTRDGGQSWSTFPRLSTNESFRSAVAVDSAWQLHVTWTEFVSQNRQVFYARLSDAGSWADRIQLSDTPGYSGFPSIAVDSADRVHVVWYGFDGTTYQVYYRYRAGGGPWSTTVQATRGVSDANAPALAIGPDDRLHVTFFASIRALLDVYYLAGGPEGWSMPERVNPQGIFATRPSVAVHVNGTPAIAYVSAANNSSVVVYTERSAEGRWSAGEHVSAPGENGDDPSLATSVTNGTAVVYYDTGDGRILYRVREPGGTWQEEVTLSVGPDAQWPSASWDIFHERNVERFVVWTQGEASAGYQLAFAKAPAFNLPPSPPGPGTTDPGLAMLVLVAGAVAVIVSAMIVGGALWRSSRRR